MASGGVGVAEFLFASTPDIFHEPDMTSRRPVKSLPVWNSRTSPLNDVLCNRSTPMIVRDRGRRDDVVTPRDIYVHSVTSCNVVVVDGLTTDPRRGLVSTGRRYLIPVDHRGWFELLSQDGHAAAPIGSVQHLMKLAPERCLVRRTIVGQSADDVQRRPCKVIAGETLSVEGVTMSPVSRTQCVRCRVDSTGQGVLLSVDQRGLFSPVAGPTNVAGVHRMRSIVAKFRFPVVVRLITRSSPLNDPSLAASIAFRLTALETEPAAYIVPLSLIKTPSDAGRRTLLWLPTMTQASSVLDGVTSTNQTTPTASDNWTETDWNELRRRCDELIKSRAVTAEITRFFSNTSGPVKSSVHPSSQQPSSVNDNRRLLLEIDQIYESIKTKDLRAVKNGTRTTPYVAAPRYRSALRLDTATFNQLGGAVKTRSPARRSNTIDPSSHSKPTQQPPTHHNSSIDLVQSQPLGHVTRQTSPSPVRLRRMASHVTSSSVRHYQQPGHMEQQRHHTEPVYDELNHVVNASTTPPVDTDTVDGHSPTMIANNLRQVIKNNSPTTTVNDQTRRWSVAVVSDNNNIVTRQLQVVDGQSTTKPDNVTCPVTSRLDGDKSPADVPQSDTVSRSVSSGRLTSSSSDDVTAGDRKSASTSPQRRHAEHAGGRRGVLHGAVLAGTLGGPSRHADDVTVTSQMQRDAMLEVACGGGKVTYF